MKLDWKTQGRIFARSLLIQGAWNYERMQGLGFAWCLAPWLKRLYVKGSARLKAAWQRQMDYFNTQPYMAGIVLGVAAKMEESAVYDPGRISDDRISQVKKSMGAALAGIGDPLFWGAWRPLCAAMAMGLGFVLPTSHRRAVLIGILTYLILYNIPAVWLRWSGIRWGYDFGEQVAEKLKRLRFHRSLARIRQSGLAFAAVFAVAAVLRVGERGLQPAAIRGGLLLLCLGMKQAGWGPLKAYAALTALGVLTALTLS